MAHNNGQRFSTRDRDNDNVLRGTAGLDGGFIPKIIEH